MELIIDPKNSHFDVLRIVREVDKNFGGPLENLCDEGLKKEVEKKAWKEAENIPKLFLYACEYIIQKKEEPTLEMLTYNMDIPFKDKGHLTNSNIYRYPAFEDDDLQPLMVISQDQFQCVIFENDLVAVRYWPSADEIFEKGFDPEKLIEYRIAKVKKLNKWNKLLFEMLDEENEKE